MRRLLDTLPSLLYIPARLTGGALLAALLLVGSEARAAGEFKARGVVLPGGAVRVAEERYRLPESYDAAVRFYRSVYRPERFPRKLVVNQPGVKAVHVVNPDLKSEWEGFNLYEHQGEVRLYILVRQKN